MVEVLVDMHMSLHELAGVGPVHLQLASCSVQAAAAAVGLVTMQHLASAPLAGGHTAAVAASCKSSTINSCYTDRSSHDTEWLY